MTKIREEMKNMILTFVVRGVIQKAQPVKDIPEINTGLLDGESIKRLENLCRSWALEERKEILGELVSAVDERLVDYRPKPNVKYLAIKWDDLSEIITGLEEKQ